MPASTAADVTFDNTGTAPLKVAGLGVPLEYDVPFEKRFRTGHTFVDESQDHLTVREVGMIQLIESLTDKPEWQRKIRDPDIVARWKAEALANITFMTEDAFDWCMRELADKADVWQQHKYITTLETKSRVLKSDALVAPELIEQLKTATKPLLDREPKDWHPRSDDQVLNLVHPSLFPLVYGRTRMLKEGTVGLDDCQRHSGLGDVIPVPELAPKSKWDVQHFSARFQWLPCEVAFKGEAGTDVEVTSYINNLPPTHKELYRAIEKAVSLSIEPWNQILVRGSQGRVPVRILVFEIEASEPLWQDPDLPEDLWEMRGPEVPGYDEALKALRDVWESRPDNPLMERLVSYPDGLSKDSTFEELLAASRDLDTLASIKHTRSRKVKIPDVASDDEAYQTWRDEADKVTVNLETEFRKQGLQVIVKLGGIELTPDKPTYAGGSWHLEGMQNEHIVATSILYYDVDNVTPARIKFRHEAGLDCTESEYEQGDHEPWSLVFGTSDMSDGPVTQELGSVATPHGRLLAFPNTLQHAVEPFELEDKTRPGHRRFLVLWLVDPNYRIPSTRNVPPQQKGDALDLAMRSISDRLPAELTEQVYGNVDWLMSLDEAKELRLELMEERTKHQKQSEKVGPTFNFCEH